MRCGIDMRGNEIKFACAERVGSLPNNNLFAGRVVTLIESEGNVDTGKYYYYNGVAWEPLFGIANLADRVDDIEELIPSDASSSNKLATVSDIETYEDFSGSGTGHAHGLVPDPGATAGTTKYLREDGTWEVPPNTTYSDFVGSGSSHAHGLVPDPGSTAGTKKYLREDGTWEEPPDTTYDDFVGSGSNHAKGLVPDPGATAGTTKYLREDGTWETPPDTKYVHPSYTAHEAGLYLITVDASGHISAATPVQGTDLPSHTHNYAGSNSAGGAATSANKLNIGESNVGSATKPVYFNSTTGQPSECTYSLEKSVPSDAKFTDTTYSDFVGSGSSHAQGLVPDPGATAGTTKYLREDGTWETPPNTTYSDFVGSGSSHAHGLVPDPGASAGTTKYLREDGTWETPPDTNTTYDDFVGSGSSHAHGLVPDPGATAGTTKYLREDGTWTVPPDTNTTYDTMAGSGTGHAGGLVPDPGATAGTTKYLREDGTWETPPNTTYSTMVGSGSGHAGGLVPDPGATSGATKYLREDGTWAVPASGGGSDPVNRFYANKSYLTRNGNDWFQTVSIEPGASYVFDCTDYTWVQVQTYNSAGSVVNSYGHGFADMSVSFTAGSTEVSARLGFYPGFSPGDFDEDFETINWDKISFVKTGETLNDAMTEVITKVDNMVTPVIPQLPATTNITDILANATSASPVTITLMGDSITAGYSADTGKSWAALLKAYIESVYSNVTVNNTGVSGWKSSDAVDNIATAMPTGTTIAIAMFGTNNRQTQAYMDALYGDYTTFYERAQSIGAKFIPMCCTAETLINESISAKYITDMSDVHRVLSKWSKDHNLEMIDLYEGILKYCNYDSDIFDTFFNQTETTTVSSVTYPFHIHPTNDGHYVMYRLIAEALGIAAPVTQYTAIAGGGGGGAPKYLHRIYLYRKGYYYLSFDLYTGSSTSFQGDTQTVFSALAAEFTNQSFTSYSWRSIPQVTGWYRETSDGTAIPICAIYYDTNSGHFIGVREGVSLTTFANATVTLSNMEEYSTSPKGSIFDNNIQAIGGGGGSSEEVEKESFACATGFSNFSTNSIVFKKGTVGTLSIILTVGSNGASPNTTLGTVSSQFRPPSTIVLPGMLSWESNADNVACGVNLNANGTVVYYGPNAPSGRHICINGSYLLS